MVYATENRSLSLLMLKMFYKSSVNSLMTMSDAQDISFTVASRWTRGSVEVHLPPLLVGESSWCAQDLLKKATRLGQKLRNVLLKYQSIQKGGRNIIYESVFWSEL